MAFIKTIPPEEAEGLLAELYAAADDLLRLREPFPFGEVVGLLRALELRVGQLDAPAQENLRRARRAGDRDERRPAGVGPQPDRHRPGRHHVFWNMTSLIL